MEDKEIEKFNEMMNSGKFGNNPPAEKKSRETAQVGQEVPLSPVKPNYSLSTSQPVCPECGYCHPPLPRGKVCPGKKKVDVKSENGEKTQIDFTDFSTKLKNIIMSQIEKKGLKEKAEIDGFLKFILIELTKKMETYDAEFKEFDDRIQSK